MKRNFILAIALAAFLAVPAFASVQNIKVSGDLIQYHVYRTGHDLGVVTTDQAQNIFATIARVGIDADLSDNVSTTIRLTNERLWGSENAAGSDIDLDLAYVTLREMLYSPLTVTIGRQELIYGNSFVIGGNAGDGLNNPLAGSAGDLSEKRAFDAIKLELDYDPLTIDLFYAKLDDNSSTISGNAGDTDDIDLFGAVANYQLGDDMETEVEAYVFARIDDTTDGVSGKHDTVYTPGVRVATSPTEDLSVSAEFAVQRGTSVAGGVNKSRDAWALQVGASLALPVFEDYSPVLSVEYSHYSGDATPGGTSDDEAWDEQFEWQDIGRIYDNLYARSNLKVLEIAQEFTPMEDLTATVSWTKLWLAEDATGSLTLNQPDGSTVAAGTKPGEDDLGSEFDVDLSYDYTEDVSFGLTAGWYLPGDAFVSTNEQTASQVVTSVNVAF